MLISRPAPLGAASRPRPAVGAFWPLWLGALVLPLAGFVFSAWLAWQDVRADGTARVLRQTDLLHEHALRAFETQEVLLSVIEARIRGMGWEEIAASEEVHLFLAELNERAPLIMGLGLVDPAGRMVQGSGRMPPVPPDQNDRDYVQAHRRGHEGTYVGTVVISRPDGRPVFTLSRARTGPDGAADGGVIVTAFASAAFERFYQGMRETEQDRVALNRADGAVLARYPPLEGPTTVPEGSPGVAAVAEGRRAGVFETRSRLDGTLRLNAFRMVGDYPVFVLYGLSEATLRAAWLARLPPLAAITLAAALLLLLLTARAQRAALREAAALERAAAEAEGARAAAEARAEAEQRLRQSERIAALGQVAAGVAHDMNNVVQSVLASARLLDRAAEAPPEVRRIGALLGQAAERGRRLALRMLEFSRPPARSDDGFELAFSLNGLGELLGGLLGSGVRLVAEVAPGLPRAMADRAEFETVLVNLAVNARDAMPAGGEVRVSAALAAAGPPALRRAGPWLRIEVADTGEGMPEEVLQRAGEPFFTTKPPGQGTGLGLMMARHFCERAGGLLQLDSAPGAGTRVTLWLPAAEAEATAEAAE